MFTSVLLLAATLQVEAQGSKGAGESSPEIVVVAPQVTGEALAACLARKCSPLEDVRATISHAQAQFANGEYADARLTLWKSIERNRKHEKTQPRAVSALFHALSRVTLHNGDADEYRRMALRSATILARSPVIEPHERVAGQMRLGDAYASLGELDMARATYRSAQGVAQAIGLKPVADLIRVREVWMRALSGLDSSATAALVAMAQDMSLAPEARGSAATLASSKLQPGSSDFAKMLDLISHGRGEDAVLIWSPKTPLLAEVEAQKEQDKWGLLPAPGRGKSSEVRGIRWANIGYWVRPDGRVEDARVIAGPGNREWTKQLVKMFSDRQFAPFTPKPGSDGVYRVERVTLTHAWQVPANSNVRRRVGLPSYQFERLSEDPFGPRND